MSLCPCRSLDQKKLNLEECCGPYLSGKKKAPTAESLMRARYSAYAVKNIDYIDTTQIVVNNEVFNKEEALTWADSSEWSGLEIKKTQKGQAEDQTGIVEFVAHYKDKASGTELKHHETSLFQKDKGEWKFKEGQIHGAQPQKRLEPKVGRNDPCPCGSGKKYKKCCGA
ncbi:MAG TPA: YchJ family protein [Bacteriovoracaceae bacterium]|nr:YchJ family protein [Bacteriovoracaceae bacterium]